MALDMLQCCHTQFAACCNLSIPMGYGWAANTTELILQTFSSVNVAVWVPFTRWTEENHRKPINHLFRTFWMWTHFVLVPSLQSLLVRLQSHPMVQQCTQGAPTTNSWRTRNLKRCSALCGRRPSLTLLRGTADCSRSPRPNNLWKKAWHRSQQLVRAWKSWRRRPLFPKRATQKLILALQFWDFILRTWSHISWLSWLCACLSLKVLTGKCFWSVKIRWLLYMPNGDWKSIIAQLQPCQWPGFKHVCSCDASKHAKYRESNLNPLVLTSTSTDLVNARWTGPMQMCLTLVACCIPLLLQLMTIGQGHGNTLESYGYRGGPMGTAVEICWNGNMLSDTTDGGSLTGKATRRLAIWLLGNFCEEWRVVLEASLTHSRSVASARSTDPVGSHSADSCTRIHCRECCAGATCQPALAPTWMYLPDQADTSLIRTVCVRWWSSILYNIV